MSQDISTILAVPFHDDTITAVETPDGEFVAVRPICERFGLAWQPQHRKLTTNPRWGVTNMVIPSAGGMQEMTCIPVSKVFGWLANITVSRVKPELRERLALYQEEADKVLDRYFRQRIADRQVELEHLRWQLDRAQGLLLALVPKLGRLRELLAGGMWIDSAAAWLNWSQDRTLEARRMLEEIGVMPADGVFDDSATGLLREVRRLKAENTRLSQEMYRQSSPQPLSGEG